MQRERILEYLRAALTTLFRDVVVSAPIVGPNELAEVADSPLFFEVYASEREVLRETERDVVVCATGAIVANARLGEGSSRLDAVADRIARFFAQGRPGARGFSETDYTGRRALVYPTSVRRATPEVVDGRYKTTIQIDFEIFEEG
ncbi:MAG: hypothetical protein IJL92_01250 [Thermoguttaceae bacterium]|nr:hypothetical protein [Thermoguttaceae bacterium]